MDFDSLIKKRHSARSFTSKKASWKNILDSIESALHGPFAGNHEHLKFLIVENQKTIKEIAKHSSQGWINESGILIVVCSDDSQLENLYGERGRFYGKQQAGAAIMTILLKLTSLGLSSCWVGAFTDELIRNTLNIPSHIEIEAIIPIGYENKSRKIPRKKKKELENVLLWESWNNKRRLTAGEELKK